MEIDVRLAQSRFVTRTDWVDSRHSFSYGRHYDPANVRFGVLAAHNDDLLQPGGGFTDHPHRGIDIVTWVVTGALEHADDTGGSAVVTPGVPQLLSSGAGVRHSEINVSDGVTRYIQMWISSDDGDPPAHSTASVSAGWGSFAIVASGGEPAPLRLRQPGASLFAARLRAGFSLPVPTARFVHLFVVSGAALLGDVPLVAGDAARVTEASSLALATEADAEVLAWAMNAEAWRPT
jgi:redox-sensitive bicupin YhaK (pirin superfamily)